MLARAAGDGIARELPTAVLQLVEVAERSSFAPCSQRVGGNTKEIGLGKAR